MNRRTFFKNTIGKFIIATTSILVFQKASIRKSKLIGYKSTELINSKYFYAPYVPLYVTDHIRSN